MSRSYATETRRRLMAQVLRVIERNPDIRIDELEAEVGIEIGLSPRKLKEYLQQFTAAGRIVRTERGFKLKES